MENMADVLSEDERLTLLRLLKKWASTRLQLTSKRANPRLIVPERRVVLRSTIRNFSDLLEFEAAHLSEPP